MVSKELKIDQLKLEKLNKLKEININPYPYSFKQTHFAKELNEKYANLEKAEHTNDEVSVAGRIMLKRVMGKSSFAHIQDETGKVQVYFKKDILGEKYDLIKKLIEVGDIIGVKGVVFKTKMGEVTIEVKDFELLSKSLLPMPEKFHGLKDVELRYRQRYVDLFTNPEAREIFKKRSIMLKTIRQYLDEKGFIEVETPILQPIYGGAKAKPFITHINAWDMKMYLSISPELYLKRLLVGGLERVYTIAKNFRNEDADTTHNPEFTMLELYQAYVDYNTMMKYVEEMYEKACIAMNGTTKVKHVYQGKEVEIDFKAPWKKMTMAEAIKEYAQIDVMKLNEEELKEIVHNYNIEYEGDFSWGLGVELLFEELVEDKLIQPVHIIDHPKESTPLCKVHRKDERLIERFESFCLGTELCNAYSELNDPIKQRELLEKQAEELRSGMEESNPMDEDFIHALEYGMPPAGGLGVGIDRMAILLTGVQSIRDVILFPTMRPLPKEENKKD